MYVRAVESAPVVSLGWFVFAFRVWVLAGSKSDRCV